MTGKQFRAWRKANDLSLRDVQAIVGISINTMSRFENGKEIINSNHQKLVNLVNEAPQDNRKAKIRWHIAQLEILIESEEGS